MLAAAAAAAIVAVASKEKDCECHNVIQPQHPHQCQLCNRKFSACLTTNELQHKITLQAHEISRLKKELHACEFQVRNQTLDFQRLNTKCQASIDTMAEIQCQKEQADRELEDLSARLFEEANNMVASEKKKRMQLQNKLEMTEDQLVNERNQLRELKSRMESLLPSVIAATSSSSSSSSITSFEYTANHRHRSSANILACKSHGIADTTTTTTTNNNMDHTKIATSKRHNTIASSILATAMSAPSTTANKMFDSNLSQVKMFQTYLERYSNSRGGDTIKRSNRASSYFDSESESEEEQELGARSKDSGVSLDGSLFHYTQISVSPAQQSEYIMQIEKEDIELCLGFGNSESRMCVKVMMECMLNKPCFIEYVTLDTAKSIPLPMQSISSAYYRPLWERWCAVTTYNESEQLLACAACGRKINIEQQQKNRPFYRFRLVEQDDWLLIDGHCRDRLVAVCNFYSFVRNIQLGLYQNRSFEDLYQENVKLRLKMFYSRMGVV